MKRLRELYYPDNDSENSYNLGIEEFTVLENSVEENQLVRVFNKNKPHYYESAKRYGFRMGLPLYITYNGSLLVEISSTEK